MYNWRIGIGVIASIFRTFKIRYNTGEERVQSLSYIIVLPNDFVILYQRDFLFRHKFVRKKRFYSFPKKIILVACILVVFHTILISICAKVKKNISLQRICFFVLIRPILEDFITKFRSFYTFFRESFVYK